MGDSVLSTGFVRSGMLPVCFTLLSANIISVASEIVRVKIRTRFKRMCWPLLALVSSLANDAGQYIAEIARILILLLPWSTP